MMEAKGHRQKSSIRLSIAPNTIFLKRVDGNEKGAGFTSEVTVLPGDHIFGFYANPMFVKLLQTDPSEEKVGAFDFDRVLHYVKLTVKAGTSYHINMARGEGPDDKFPIYIEVIEDGSGIVVSTPIGNLRHEPSL